MSAATATRKGLSAEAGRVSHGAPSLPHAGWLWAGLGLSSAVAILYLFLGTPLNGSFLEPFLLALSCFLPAEVLRRRNALQFGWIIVAGAIGLCLYSVVVGYWNGLTDEGGTTALYAGLFPNLYSTPLVHSYSQYGRTLVEQSYYVYLPLMTFVQVPGLYYSWVTVGCWVGILVLLRDRPYALAVMGAPYVGLLAANGFNDFVPLVLLTFAYAYKAHPKLGRVGELISLGTKQFAVVISVFYHAAQKQWKKAAISVAVMGAFLLPFVYLDGVASVWCHAIVADGALPSGCQSRGVLAGLTSFLNYWLYPVWALALFASPFFAWVRSDAWAGYRREAAGMLGSAAWKLPDELTLVTAWLLWMFEWPRRKLGRFFRFCVVGLTGVGVNLVVFTAALEFLPTAAPWVFAASGAAFLVASTSNFALNYAWTFQDAVHRAASEHWALYMGCSVLAFGANEGVLYALLPHTTSLTAQVVGVFASCAVGFTANSRWNFRLPAARAEAAQRSFVASLERAGSAYSQGTVSKADYQVEVREALGRFQEDLAGEP